MRDFTPLFYGLQITSPVFGFRVRVLGYIGFRWGVTGERVREHILRPVPKKDFFIFFIFLFFFVL
jgi:hypothetical protein